MRENCTYGSVRGSRQAFHFPYLRKECRDCLLDAFYMDEKEVRRVVETYSDMILRISYNYLQHTFDAEDICQTVLLKYISCDLSFDTTEHEKAWLIRTAINACHDLRKSAYSRKTVGLEDVTEKAAPPAPDPDLSEEIKKLPVNYRMSIYISYLQPLQNTAA